MHAFISAHKLRQLITSGPVCLIDVLLPEDFTCRHIANTKKGRGGAGSGKHDS